MAPAPAAPAPPGIGDEQRRSREQLDEAPTLSALGALLGMLVFDRHRRADAQACERTSPRGKPPRKVGGGRLRLVPTPTTLITEWT